MAATFTTRSLAAQAARRRGIEAFSCDILDNGQWGYNEEVLTDRFRDAVKFGREKDYVHHVEQHKGEPILIVTCYKEELASERLPYRVLPLTPSLWDSHDKDIRSLSGHLPQGRQAVKPEARVERTSPKGAVAMVHEICANNQEKTRKEIIALCEQAGIHPSTAATQYAKWVKANKK